MSSGKVQLYGGKLLLAGGKVTLCEDDCCEPCSCCKNNVYPDELTATVAGVRNLLCDDCLDINDSWVLPKITNCTAESTFCYVVYQDSFEDVDLCFNWLYEYWYLVVQIYIYWYPESSQRRIVGAISLRRPPAWEQIADYVLLQEEAAEPFDCANFANLDIPFSDAGPLCDCSSSTFKVST